MAVKLGQQREGPPCRPVTMRAALPAPFPAVFNKCGRGSAPLRPRGLGGNLFRTYERSLTHILRRVPALLLGLRAPGPISSCASPPVPSCNSSWTLSPL